MESERILTALRGVRSDAIDVALWAQSELAKRSIDPTYIEARRERLYRLIEHKRATINHGADVPHMLPRLPFWWRLRLALAMLLLP